MKQCLIAKITTLLQQVPVVGNLARQKFMAHFVISLLKSRNVQFCEVAQHLNDAVKPASNETRIQDFFRQVSLDYAALARLLLRLLPGQGPVRLCLDRTGWHFGRTCVNVLLVTAGRGEWHVPLYWQLLANGGGNSNAAQRIAVLEQCVAAVGRDAVEVVLGDREFVGGAWFKWLHENQLPFLVRMPKHHPLVHADGRRQAVDALGLAPEQVRCFGRVQVDGVWGKARVQALAGGGISLPLRQRRAARPGPALRPALEHRAVLSKPERPGLQPGKQPLALPGQAHRAPGPGQPSLRLLRPRRTKRGGQRPRHCPQKPRPTGHQFQSPGPGHLAPNYPPRHPTPRRHGPTSRQTLGLAGQTSGLLSDAWKICWPNKYLIIRCLKK